METTDYVSYPIALALKKHGFDEPCMAFYTHTDGKMWVANGEEDWNSGIDYSAPTLWQAQKWLREKWDWHIDVFPATDCSFDADGQLCEEWNYWDFDIMHVISTRKIIESEERYDSFEEALSAGIAAALELIEKKGK